MARRTNRRDFMKTTAAAAGAGFWVASHSRAAESTSANEKLNVAFIGVAGRGGGNLGGISAFDDVNVVALCDVDEGYAAKSFAKFPKAAKYQDYRVMIEKEKGIDAVVISTPDHHHAIAAMMAIKLGKHVYCEKPLTHTPYEARMLTQAAAEYKVATQMGNQGTAENGMREAVEVIQSGAIGHVREVHVWTNRPVWPQGAQAALNHSGVQMALHGECKDHEKRSTCPNDTHWDLWLGPAPYRPFNRAYFPFVWRGWWDFGTGALGDMACHTANMAFMACKLGSPTSVEAEVSELNSETCPLWSVIRYEFPARGDLPPLKWTWYDGGNEKPAWVNKKLKELAHGGDIPGSGSLLIGDKGTLFSPNDYGAAYTLLPEKDFEGYKPPAPSLPRSPGHHREFVDACKGGPPAMSNFSYAGPLTETVVLGNVAMRVGKKIEWDGPNLKVTNVPEAEQYVRGTYREGWSL
ncbi:MAG: Gfo/Idh/MocA family oxidoreductase [Phycisphaerae bacterium]|nr:Gfo/Idh/MocA family oxidoreductase [Phycisphaerae bacterium]